MSQKKELLRRGEVKIFNNKELAEQFFIEQRGLDEIRSCKISEMEIVEIPNAPIMISEIREKLKVAETIPDETLVSEGMEGVRLGLRFPVGDKMGLFPMTDNGLVSVMQRAGIQSATAITGDRVNAENKTTALNALLPAFMGGKDCTTYVRDNRLMAVFSNEWCDFPVPELFNELEMGLREKYPSAAFVGATASHEHATIEYALNSKPLKAEIEEIFSGCGLSSIGDELYPYVKLATSDIGVLSATLYSYVRNAGGTTIPVGDGVPLSHKDKHSMADFRRNVECVFTSMRELKEALMPLKAMRVKYPGGCLCNIAQAMDIPKKIILEECIMFDIEFPEARAIDVFWKTMELVDVWAENAEMTPFRKVQLTENICRKLLKLNYIDASFDAPLRWLA